MGWGAYFCIFGRFTKKGRHEQFRILACLFLSLSNARNYNDGTPMMLAVNNTVRAGQECNYSRAIEITLGASIYDIPSAKRPFFLIARFDGKSMSASNRR